MKPVIEAVALKLDLSPLNGLWRFGLGVALYPIYDVLCRAACPDWIFLPYTLFVLVGLRIGPLVLRKLLKFSPAAQKIWDERRQLAKIYDSFQWRKLLWIGAGLWVYLRYSNVKHDFATAIAMLFTIGGAIGLLTWISVSRKIKLESTAKMA